LADPHQTSDPAYDINKSMFGVSVGVVYKFKNINGTHNFRTYDIGAMNAEIDQLRAELAKKPKEVEVIKIVEKEVAPATAGVASVEKKDATTFVFFAKNSAVLSDAAKETLKSINATSVNIKAYASPEGAAAYNQKLSERRAAAVQDFLTNNTNVKVVSADGCGVNGAESARVAIVTAE
jgi:outer membrane protein OmpA-like peptidoglycan-associated protein